MIVGTKNIDLKQLRKIYKHEALLNDFCISLVPRYVRHVNEIVMNQRYLVALQLRNLESIPFKEREYWSNYLVKDIHVTGIPTRLIEWNDVMMHIDIDYLLRYIIQELKGDKYEKKK